MGEHVELYFAAGERGNGGIECATVYRDPDGTGFAFWTHGGPNAGTDWHPRDGELPILFRRITGPSPLQISSAMAKQNGYWYEEQHMQLQAGQLPGEPYVPNADR